MPNISDIIQFVDYMAMKGMPIVAGSLFVLLCLWGLWQFLSHVLAIGGVLREWLPQWFASQISLHKACEVGIASNTLMLGEIKKDTSQLVDWGMENQSEQSRILRKEAARGVS